MSEGLFVKGTRALIALGVVGSVSSCREYTCVDTATCSYAEPDAGDAGTGEDASATAADDAGDVHAVDGGTSGEQDTSANGFEAGVVETDTTAVASLTSSGQTDAAVSGSDVATQSSEGDVSSEARSSEPVTPGGGTSDVETTSSPNVTSDESSSDPGVAEDPAGYWRQDEWKGCVWTAIDAENGTTIQPLDFTARTGGDYCVSGVVAASEGWSGAALLAFNLNQGPAAADCGHESLDENGEGQPTVTPGETGLALNFAKRGLDRSFPFRVVLWGPDGANDSSQRWCVDVTTEQGKVFIPWSDFNTECWEDGDGDAYEGQPVSSVVFAIPGNGWPEGESGTAEDIPFDFCIRGLAAGDTVQDAPDSQNHLSGEIGGDAPGADYERVKVTVDGETYVIQNNNWGNEAGAQTLSFVNDSFEVTDGPDGSPSCQGCPLSFPAIYIGANGNTADGEYITRQTDNLPAAIGDITSVTTHVAWSGNAGASASATYELWFAKPSRGDLTGKRYNDALDGAIMVWLHDPAGGQPIGSVVATVTINGMQWDVWRGPRGSAALSGDADLIADANAPVISYVAKSSSNTFDGDLKAFLVDAQEHSDQVTEALLVTDVFFGFEIWSGGQGLSVDSFMVDVQK